MDQPKCPHCGTTMRIELNGALITHPGEIDCPAAGMAFRTARKAGKKDKRLTWSEYWEKHDDSPFPAPALDPVAAQPAPVAPPAPAPAPAPMPGPIPRTV